MRCIICDGPAERGEAEAAHVAVVRCPRCGEFEVSDAASKVLAGWEPYARLQALRYAQTNAQPGRRPHLHGIV
ncbi:hypothetical protein [Aurantimonas marianensis]|uniref:Uncharacterized protein n=1 Tax=Aurantimonas marianensis TaxID=2920428 RepID=A0A9X2H568_9HYPH|nr:hypothetical protein [Aurantimonas marianensis]MCP3055860.1 hypothetical protein [Aurantimonas marianensis]